MSKGRRFECGHEECTLCAGDVPHGDQRARDEALRQEGRTEAASLLRRRATEARQRSDEADMEAFALAYAMVAESLNEAAATLERRKEGT